MAEAETTATLPTVAFPQAARDRVFVARSLPMFSGNGDQSLACGGCGALVAERVVVDLLYRNLEGTDRVIVTCTCGAHNLLLTERRKTRRVD